MSAEGISRVTMRLDDLANKHIVSESADGRIHCHSLVREYCHRVLSRPDRERLHQRAAECYEQKEDYLAAAHHRFEGGDLAQALTLLTDHAQAIINAGGAGALLEQLSRFQRRLLNTEQWIALCKAKGDAHRMRGDGTAAGDSSGHAAGQCTHEQESQHGITALRASADHFFQISTLRTSREPPVRVYDAGRLAPIE